MYNIIEDSDIEISKQFFIPFLKYNFIIYSNDNSIFDNSHVISKEYYYKLYNVTINIFQYIISNMDDNNYNYSIFKHLYIHEYNSFIIQSNVTSKLLEMLNYSIHVNNSLYFFDKWIFNQINIKNDGLINNIQERCKYIRDELIINLSDDNELEDLLYSFYNYCKIENFSIKSLNISDLIHIFIKHSNSKKPGVLLLLFHIQYFIFDKFKLNDWNNIIINKNNYSFKEYVNMFLLYINNNVLKLYLE